MIPLTPTAHSPFTNISSLSSNSPNQNSPHKSIIPMTRLNVSLKLANSSNSSKPTTSVCSLFPILISYTIPEKFYNLVSKNMSLSSAPKACLSPTGSIAFCSLSTSSISQHAISYCINRILKMKKCLSNHLKNK